jgi:hypothetical protein
MLFSTHFKTGVCWREWRCEERLPSDSLHAAADQAGFQDRLCGLSKRRLTPFQREVPRKLVLCDTLALNTSDCIAGCGGLEQILEEWRTSPPGRRVPGRLTLPINLTDASDLNTFPEPLRGAVWE